MPSEIKRDLPDTITEKHTIDGRQVFYVKREDLACPSPGPPFAKVRGLYPRLLSLKKRGVTHVGYMETSVSMAAWGISYFAKKLGMSAVIYMPHYKDGFRDEQKAQVKKWKRWGAVITPLEKPNRLSINYYRAKKMFLQEYPQGVFLEHGIPLQETITSVSEQVRLLPKEAVGGTIVMSIGSGVMSAGVIVGMRKYFPTIDYDLWGILAAPKNAALKRSQIMRLSGIKMQSGLFKDSLVSLFIKDDGYAYTQKELCPCPFPCNPYYDRKAFRWLRDNIHMLRKPVLFWNIGA